MTKENYLGLIGFTFVLVGIIILNIFPPQDVSNLPRGEEGLKIGSWGGLGFGLMFFLYSFDEYRYGFPTFVCMLPLFFGLVWGFFWIFGWEYTLLILIPMFPQFLQFINKRSLKKRHK